VQVLCPADYVGITNANAPLFRSMGGGEPPRLYTCCAETQRYSPLEIVRGGVVAIER
jgi:hypothetical protein